MYLQDSYLVTTTTNLDAVEAMVSGIGFDLVVLDGHPSDRLEKVCVKIREISKNLPIVLTYVYKNQFKDSEERLRKLVTHIFYKPFELGELTAKLPAIVEKTSVSDN